MKNQSPLLLYQIFEKSALKRTKESENTTAIWHVPYPRQLEKIGKFETSNADVNLKIKDLLVHTLTFQELLLAVRQLSHGISKEIQRAGLVSTEFSANNSNVVYGDMAYMQENAVIAIFMPPGIDRIVAQIACMKLRLAYLPLDRQLSSGRIQRILELIRPIMVITAKEYHDVFLNLIKEPLLKSGTYNVRCVMQTQRDLVQGHLVRTYTDLFHSTPEHNVQSDCVKNGAICENSGFQDQDDPCYFLAVTDPVIIILFTSGSTTSGPKVVRLRNTQLLNRFQWQWKSNFQLDENKQWRNGNAKSSQPEVHLASTACVFIDAFTELFGALFAGIPVVVPGGPDFASEMCVSDLRILVPLVYFFRITRLTTVPVQLKIWTHQSRLINKKGYHGFLDTLNTIVVSGDILLPQMAEEVFSCHRKHPITLVNLYGTTEVAGDVTAAVFSNQIDVQLATKRLDSITPDRINLKDVSFISVGKPIFNTAVYVVQKLDDSLNKLDTQSCISQPSGCERVTYNELEKDSFTRLSVIGKEMYPIDWYSLGYKLCEKGCVGEIVITGLPVGSTKSTALNGDDGITDHSDCPDNPILNFPGDLGFICPTDNMLYICGRSDELVKINAVGFLAGDLDRLLLKIKEHCMRSSNPINSLETKLCHFIESVTLPIRHPVSESSQLVCFYAVDTMIHQDKIDLSGQVDIILSDHSSCAQETVIIRADSELYARISPKPCELSVIIANHVPIYIRPIFIPVTHIPVMPTSGKIDKQLLRSLYGEPFSSDSELFHPLGSTPGKSSAELIGENMSPLVKSVIQNDYQQEPREQARAALMRVLGLQRSSPVGGKPRPRDDEDFYLLGGNSLLAVLALETLRQAGFRVRLETFYHTGNIGQILDSLVYSKANHSCENGSFAVGSPVYGTMSNGRVNSFEEEDGVEHVHIDIVEWNRLNDKMKGGRHPEEEDIRKILIESFIKKDVLTHVFGLSHDDLMNAVSTYLQPEGVGIVLLAFCQPEEVSSTQIFDKGKLAGVLLAIPSDRVPELPPKWERLNLLQKYFDFCCTPLETNDSTQLHVGSSTLTVMMVGILLSTSDEFSHSAYSVRARWNRVMLEILARLELQLVEVAKEKGFSTIETLNTCEITREVCMDLGYRLYNTTRMQSFATSENVALDPKYYDHQSYYMVKSLTE